MISYMTLVKTKLMVEAVMDLGGGSDGGDRPSLQEKFFDFPSKSERK
jgi:hypothetical protein